VLIEDLTLGQVLYIAVGGVGGNGLVQIEALSTPMVPGAMFPVPDATSTAGLLGLSLAALGVVRRRFAC
jgi:hypothetical protein